MGHPSPLQDILQTQVSKMIQKTEKRVLRSYTFKYKKIEAKKDAEK